MEYPLPYSKVANCRELVKDVLYGGERYSKVFSAKIIFSCFTPRNQLLRDAGEKGKIERVD